MTPLPATPVVFVSNAAPFPTLVYFQEVPTWTPVPSPEPTHIPYVDAMTVVAMVEQPTPTPDQTTCPATPTLLPPGTLCTWPDPAPTATVIPRCETPIPRQMCDPWAATGVPTTPLVP
jgi:hypothetical protein